MARFSWQGDRLLVDSAGPERELLESLPILLRGSEIDDGSPDWARLRSVGHLGDPEAAARFSDLTAGMLESARAEDLDRFEATAGADHLDAEQAEAWLRVIGEARLAVAARIGIDTEGWEEERQGTFESAVLHLLGHLQESLVAALAERL
jgi:hypothetical protein